MKITKKILENIIKEEFRKVLKEQEGEPPTGPGMTFDVPTETLAKREPVAGYLLQALNREWSSLANQKDLDSLESVVASNAKLIMKSLNEMEARIKKLEEMLQQNPGRNIANNPVVPDTEAD